MMTPTRPPSVFSRRGQDGRHTVYASDGAAHHELGKAWCEYTVGPSLGRRPNWHVLPAPSLSLPAGPHPTLGAARRVMLEGWQARQHKPSRPSWPGRFVVVEGPDGAGKSELVAGLVSALARRGVPAGATENPSRGPVGRLLRELTATQDMPPPEELALLFAADRAMWLRTHVLPALERGDVVVSSRYTLSSLAYQGPDAGLEWVASLNRAAPPPDMVLYLDVPPAVGMARLAQRRADGFEHESRARAVVDGYARGLDVVARWGCPVVRLAGTLPPAEVLTSALAAVQELVEVPRAASVG